MKTLKITLLIISILALTGCSKDSAQDIKDDNFIKDSDGDFIPDYLDENRFIADIPLVDLELKLLINGSKDSQLLEFQNDHLQIKELKSLVVNSKGLDAISTRKYTFLPITKPIKYPDNNLLLGITEEYQLPENINGLKIQYFENEKKLLNSLNKNFSSTFDFSGLDLKYKKLSYKFIDFKFNRMNKTFSLKSLMRSVKEKTYNLTVVTDSQIKTYHISDKLNLDQALDSIPGGDDIKDDVSNWILVNTSQQSFNFHPKKGSHIYIVEITNDDQRLYYSNKETEKHRIIDGTFKFNSHRTYDVTLKLNGEMNYTLWGERFEKEVQGSDYMDFKCEIMHFWNTDHKQRINSRNMGKYFDLYLNGVLTPMPVIQNNEIKIVDIPYHTEIELRVKHLYMQTAKKGYHFGRIGRSRRCNKVLYPGGVETNIGVVSFNSLIFIDYELEITRSLAID